MTFTLTSLPFGSQDLSPLISDSTIDYHYNRHHAGYLKNMNELIVGTDYESMSSIEEIMLKSFGKNVKIFNNAAQVWNHTFYWEGLSAPGKKEITSSMASKLELSFGSMKEFKEQFKIAAMAQFGSGWTWLAEDKSELKIISTANAENPLVLGLKPLLTIDVWEHAYYLDYQNRRADYVISCLDNIINWDVVESRL